MEVPQEVIAFEAEQNKIVNFQEKQRERRLFEDNNDIYFWILDEIKKGQATAVQRQWKREFEDWQDSGMKKIFKTKISIDELLGLVTDQTYGGK